MSVKSVFTYTEVKEALANGFVSPLHNSNKTEAAMLIDQLKSFINAEKPRAASVLINELMSKQTVIRALSAPKSSGKQNFFIKYVINEIRHRNNLAGAVAVSELSSQEL